MRVLQRNILWKKGKNSNNKPPQKRLSKYFSRSYFIFRSIFFFFFFFLISVSVSGSLFCTFSRNSWCMRFPHSYTMLFFFLFFCVLFYFIFHSSTMALVLGGMYSRAFSNYDVGMCKTGRQYVTAVWRRWWWRWRRWWCYCIVCTHLHKWLSYYIYKSKICWTFSLCFWINDTLLNVGHRLGSLATR